MITDVQRKDFRGPWGKEGSLNISAVPKKSTPGKFACIRHFQRIGINAKKFQKRQFLLNVTFSLPSPSSMLKLPFVFWGGWGGGK